MDDDELHDGGFGGLAMYQLGRWSAESSAVAQDLASSLFGSKHHVVDVEQVLANNQALAAENERLRRELGNYKHNYKRLRAWADGAERKLDQLGALKD